jgi:hypothetical protein
MNDDVMWLSTLLIIRKIQDYLHIIKEKSNVLCCFPLFIQDNYETEATVISKTWLIFTILKK